MKGTQEAPTVTGPGAWSAVFTLVDGGVLEIHIPNTIGVEGRPSTTRRPGFILRRGKRIANVGELASIFYYD